ncbi:MAG: hypothetical protein ACW96U_13260 [Candidatus Heimdallarchaeaceae archaeon]|jgi:hypothetical protein
MASAKIFTSGLGLISLLFYLAGAVGGFLDGYFFWLPLYQLTSETMHLIAMILLFAVAGLCVIALIIALFGIPKVMWIILAFLSLACVVVPMLISVFQGTAFVYFDLAWYNLFMWDFIGFWLAAGGSFLAFVFGFFVPKKI